LTILMTAVLWSTAGVLVQYVKWSAYAIAGFRGICCIIVMMLGRMALNKKKLKEALPKFTTPNMLNGLFMFLTGVLYLQALKRTSAANAIVLQYIAPVLILIYGIIFEKKKPTKVDILITLMVFFGCALAFSGQFGQGGMSGDILAILSGFTFAGQLISSRNEEVNATDGVLIGSLLATVIMSPFIAYEKQESFDTANMLAVTAIGVFQYGLANLLYSRGIKRISALRASLIMTLEPVLNPVWVFIFLGQAPQTVSVIGLVFVVSALCLQAFINNKYQKEIAPSKELN